MDVRLCLDPLPPSLHTHSMDGPFPHMKDDKAYFHCGTIIPLQVTIGNAESKLLR